MNFHRLFSAKPLHPIQMVLFILIELLLIFAETFSKFHISGPFYLFDTLFFTLSLFAVFVFLRRKEKFWVWPVIGMLILSVVYLVYSYIGHLGPVNYMIRQYALFIYLGLSWLIFSSFINKEFNRFNVRFIALIGIASIIIQIGYHSYLAMFQDYYSLFGSFNYFSKMGIMGAIVFGAWAITSIHDWRIKWALVIAYLFLSTTLGHASAFLASFVIIVTYAMLGAPKKVKAGALLFLCASVVLFALFLPQFSDQNAEWRLVYWQSSISDIIKNYYAVLGHGFGLPYANEDVINAFRDQLNSPWFEVRPEEAYVTPMHNSFITIAFNIGLIPMLLLLLPLKDALTYFLRAKTSNRNKIKDFLLLSFIGVTVWSSFNVVLELPHSSSFYWLIYFTLIYQFRHDKSSIDET